MEGKQYEKEALRLQSEVSEVCRKLQLTEEKLQTTTLMLEKEKNRTRTMQSHEEVNSLVCAFQLNDVLLDMIVNLLNL